jgi:hypothetical protein
LELGEEDWVLFGALSGSESWQKSDHVLDWVLRTGRQLRRSAHSLPKGPEHSAVGLRGDPSFASEEVMNLGSWMDHFSMQLVGRKNCCFVRTF